MNTKTYILTAALLICAGCFLPRAGLMAQPYMTEFGGALGLMLMMAGTCWINWKSNPIGYLLAMLGITVFFLA
jgi:hypothetical protein